MLVYATEFPARPDAAVEDFLAVCHKWLTGSPHYPFEDLPSFPVPEGDFIDLSREGHQLRVGLIDEEAERRAGVRHVWVEAARRTWTTEVLATEAADGLWVSVNVACDMLEAGAAPPTPKKPYVIKRLFEDLSGGTDTGIAVRDRPHQFQEMDIDRAVALLTGRGGNRLPVVYVSCDFRGYPDVDVDHLARVLGGLAHVFVEPSRTFSVLLGRRVGGINPWGGAVGLFWPGANGQRSKFLPRFYSSSYDLISDVEANVREGWLFWRSPRANTWSYLTEAVSLRRLEELKARKSESLDEYVAAFDEESSALREQLQRAEARNSHLEAAIRALQEREVLRGDVIFATGREQEFYPGELRDAVLATLKEDLSGLTPGARREALINAFLAANAPSDAANQLETAIKDILSKTDRVGAVEVRALEALGFTVTEEGKHHKAVFGGDDRLTFSVFKTASDHRSGRNLASDICKKLLKR